MLLGISSSFVYALGFSVAYVWGRVADKPGVQHLGPEYPSPSGSCIFSILFCNMADPVAALVITTVSHLPCDVILSLGLTALFFLL